MENIFDLFGGRKSTAMYVAIFVVIAITIVDKLWVEIDPGYKLRGLIVTSQGLYTIGNGLKGLIDK